ncbi:MAG TPA: pitrilysin family protein [Thermoanaerobaculia bacterium]|nr:pitrilysin family protein [Thermoanaerobaculia bacterium]
MKKRSLVLVALFGVLFATGLRAADEPPFPKELPAFGLDRPLPVPPVVQLKTAEGLTVWIVARAGFPKVTAMLTVRGGSAADPKDFPDLSDLLVATVKDGTPMRSATQIAEEIQAVGGEISTATHVDALFVTVGGLAWGSDRLLTVLADIARHASFPAGEVKLAKSNALEDLQSQLSKPEFLAARAFAAALYGDHPYRAVMPTPESITAATPELLRQEFQRRFRPERALLIVIGDLDPAATVKTVTAAFGGWTVTGEAAPDAPPGPASTAHSIYLVDRPDSVQSLVVVGGLGPKVGDPDYYSLLVANMIFGGSPGSRLTRNIREDKGYTYSPESMVTPRQASGRWRVRAFVRNEVTAATLNEIRYELDRLGTTRATDLELSTAKRYLSGSYLLDNQQQSALGTALAMGWINGRTPEALAEFVSKVSAVTLTDVERAARTFFAFREQLVLVVGDGAQVRPVLEQFGPVTDLKP